MSRDLDGWMDVERRADRRGPRRGDRVANGRLRPGELVEVNVFVGNFGRGPAQEIALAGIDVQDADHLELLGGLDTLRDRQCPPAPREIDERAEDRQGLNFARSSLDEGQVDLHHIEPELAQQAETGVARADIVGGDADPRVLKGMNRGAQPIRIADHVPFGQLEEHALGGDPVSPKDGQEGRGTEFGGFKAAG